MALDAPDSVRLFMKGRHIDLDEDESISHAAQLIHRMNADAIIVRSHGTPEGIVTAKDIVKGLCAIHKPPKEIPLKDIMSTPIVFIRYGEGIDKAREKIVETGFRMLPVYHDADIIGLVKSKDILADLSWYTL